MISAITPAWWRVFTVAALIVSAQPTHAANWEICDLKVKILAPKTNAHLLFTKVLNVKGRGEAECPQKGDALEFTPESIDYQTMIPRRKWPTPNKIVSIRYRYLDGMCKNTGPCRIKHYSLMP